MSQAPGKLGPMADNEDLAEFLDGLIDAVNHQGDKTRQLLAELLDELRSITSEVGGVSYEVQQVAKEVNRQR